MNANLPPGIAYRKLVSTVAGPNDVKQELALEQSL
jgi:hypothetical protein